MIRFEDWPTRLAAFTDAARGRPFVWGEWDCCLAAAAAVLAITGEDFAADYRGSYIDREGAAAALARVAGGGVANAVRRALGEPLESPRLARRGDICLIETPAGPALGWCLGAVVACAGPAGLAEVPLRRARQAWRV